jgi:hypothetical protein
MGAKARLNIEAKGEILYVPGREPISFEFWPYWMIEFPPNHAEYAWKILCVDMQYSCLLWSVMLVDPHASGSALEK